MSRMWSLSMVGWICGFIPWRTIETLEDEVALLPTLLPCSSISPPSDSPDSAWCATLPCIMAAAPVAWFLAASAHQCAVEPATDVQTCLIFAAFAFEHLCSNFFPLSSSFFASTHSTRSLGDCHNLLSVIPSSAISRVCKYIPSASSFLVVASGV